MHYFNQIQFYLILFDSQIFDSIKIFCSSNDASYTNDSNTHKNTQNYVFILFNGFIN